MKESGGTLLGRETELERVEGWLSEAARGHGRLAWVEGEAGIGKSSLASAAIGLAAAGGFLTHSAAAAELAGGRPFETIAECLDISPDSADERRRDVAEALAAEPEGSVETGLPPTLDGGEREQWLIEQLFTIVEDDCARGPLLMVLDDVHWVDSSSLGFIARLARSAPALPLAVLATVRSGPRSERLDLIVASTTEAGAERLIPRPLDEPSVIELAELHAGGRPGPALVAQLRSCAGNPLFTSELILSLIHI